MIESLLNFGKMEIFTDNNFSTRSIFIANGSIFGLLLTVLSYIAVQNGVVFDEKIRKDKIQNLSIQY